MSARLARLAFGSAARRAQTTVASASSRVARRAMSSTTSHGAQVKSSDKPWIIGSTIVFLPAFLYLVSPSARKKEQLVHDDKHDFPTLKHKEAAAPESAPEPAPEPEKAEAHVLMTDDEGTVADVSSSIAAAKADDSPKDAQEPEQQNATIDEAKSAPVEQSSEQNKASSEDAPAKQQG
ncbi:hypothetical protein BJ912DRAFT_959835 [Pholiota molesta]|nr:hypothetical protein BJ912DRAFT_959835 [Pholiota molesta]